MHCSNLPPPVIRPVPQNHARREAGTTRRTKITSTRTPDLNHADCLVCVIVFSSTKFNILRTSGVGWLYGLSPDTPVDPCACFMPGPRVHARLYQNRLSARVRTTCRWEQQTVGSSARNFLPNLGKMLLNERKELASCDRRRATGAIDIPFGGNRTFSVRLKIALSGSLGQSSYLCCRTPDRNVPEVMAFQTKSLGDGVYRLSPFTSGAYEIFAQVRGAAPLKALVNRVTRQIEFLRQGKQEAFTSDLVIGVRKGTGKVASPTVGGPPSDTRPGTNRNNGQRDTDRSAGRRGRGCI